MIGDKSRGTFWGLFFVLFFVAAGLRLWFDLQLIHNVDEGVLAAAGSIVRGGGIPYRDVWCHRGLLSHLYYALVFILFGDYNMKAVHLLTTGLTLLSIFLVYLIAREITAKSTALASGLLFFVFVSFLFSPHDSLAANPEIIMNPLLLAGVLVFLRSRGRWLLLIFAGLLTGLAFMVKQSALVNLLLFWAFLLILNGKARGLRNIGSVFILGFSFLAPFLITSLFFFLKRCLDDFLFLFLTYNFTYLGENTLTAAGGSLVLLAIRFLTRGWLLASGFFAYTALSLKSGFSSAEKEEKTHLFLLAWLVLTTLFVSLSGRFFGHYYIQALPPLSIVTAIVFMKLNHSQDSVLRRLGRTLTLLGMMTPILLNALGPYLERAVAVFKHDARISLRKILRSEEENEQKKLVDAITSLSRKEDKIFVWGIYPELYVLARRAPASRFVFPTFLTGLVPWINVDPVQNTDDKIVPGAWEKLESDIARNRPQLILDATPGNRYWFSKYPPEKYGYLKKLLEKDYEPVVLLNGVKIYRLFLPERRPPKGDDAHKESLSSSPNPSLGLMRKIESSALSR